MALLPPYEPWLPPELLLTVFDHSLDTTLGYSTLPANQSTLCTWSLVCRSFRAIGQAKLFATPCLTRPAQLGLLLRSVEDPTRGHELSNLVREVRLGGGRGWKQTGERVTMTSSRVGVLLSVCSSVRSLSVWGAKGGLEMSALAQASALEELILIQTPLLRTLLDPPISPEFKLPALRRLDGYTYKHGTDSIILRAEVLPQLKSLSIDLDHFPPGQEAFLRQLEHVSTSDVAPCGATFPRCTVYDCWETAYSLAPPANLGITIPLPPRLRFLRVRADPDRGGERYNPTRGITHLLEHLASGETQLAELSVPRAWERGGEEWDRLRSWCKGRKVKLVQEGLPAIQWDRDWWADEAFWELVDRAEEEDRLSAATGEQCG